MHNFAFTENFTHIIDGKKVQSPTTQGIVNPSTEEAFAQVPVAAPEQLEDAICAAERAFPIWSAKPWTERQEVIDGFASLIEQHSQQFGELIMKEVGKDRAAAAWEVGGGIAWLREVAKQTLGDEIVSNGEGKVEKIRYRPYGVCAGILPFNFPLVIAIMKLSQALLAGNCLILKAPPTAPCTTLKFVELIQRVLPPGVLSVLYGGNDLGQWLVQHPRIARISMTGSTAAGRMIMGACAPALKTLTLELGGNCPAIVLDDVDPKVVAKHLFAGATHNAGQVCFCIKRIYLHEKVYDAVRDELVALAKAAKIGNPFDDDTTLGPVQNKAQYAKVQDLLADCREQGYKIAFCGGHEAAGKGYFTPLTIVENPPEDSRIVREEQFGLIIPLLKWSEEEDVIRRANDTEYGLTSTIWGNDMERVERIADQMGSGMVWVNAWGTFSGALPFGGTKHSGMEVEGSKHGLSSWTYLQAVVRNRLV